MWRLLVAARRRLRWGKNGVRVFDEAALAAGEAPVAAPARRGLVATAVAAIGALARGGGGGGGGERVDVFWGTGEMSRTEMNYLMVSDSLRYAIYA